MFRVPPDKSRHNTPVCRWRFLHSPLLILLLLLPLSTITPLYLQICLPLPHPPLICPATVCPPPRPSLQASSSPAGYSSAATRPCQRSSRSEHRQCKWLPRFRRRSAIDRTFAKNKLKPNQIISPSQLDKSGRVSLEGDPSATPHPLSNYDEILPKSWSSCQP